MGTKAVKAACTIASPNYLPLARTLAASYKAQHPGHEFFTLVVARGMDRSQFDGEPYTPVLLDDIGLENLPSLGLKYNILELNTNVKPRFMLHLLRTRALETLLYLDPDIFVYRPLEPIFKLLQSASAVLTPHMTSPADASAEQELLYNGTFNLGFVGVSHTPEAVRMLEWWDRRCIDAGYSEGRSGLFVDQKWMNLAPALFEGVVQCKHLGCNVGFWNFHERVVERTGDQFSINGQPLCFFHFSGVVVDEPEVLSRNTSRYTFSNRPDLRPLYDAYRAAARDNRRPSIDALPYGFDTFDDGTAITALARRIYAAHEQTFAGENPLASTSRFLRFARSAGLTAGAAKPPKISWKDMGESDKRVNTLHKLLRMALRTLGPNRYELLMRYLGFISILRNQGVFLKPESRT